MRIWLERSLPVLKPLTSVLMMWIPGAVNTLSIWYPASKSLINKPVNKRGLKSPFFIPPLNIGLIPAYIYIPPFLANKLLMCTGSQKADSIWLTCAIFKMKLLVVLRKGEYLKAVTF